MLNVVSSLPYSPLVCVSAPGLRVWVGRQALGWHDGNSLDWWEIKGGFPGELDHTHLLLCGSWTSSGWHWLRGLPMGCGDCSHRISCPVSPMKLSKHSVRLKHICDSWAWLSAWTNNNRCGTAKATSKPLSWPMFSLFLVKFQRTWFYKSPMFMFSQYFSINTWMS